MQEYKNGVHLSPLASIITRSISSRYLHGKAMLTLRCTEKLLKRLKQPLPVQPVTSTNPLGEWYAAIDSYDREPFVLLLNAQTGITLVLPARAKHLKEINFYAAVQLALLFEHYGVQSSLADAELLAWQQPLQFAKTQSPSLLTS